jgi:hypothetical protein
MAFSEIPASPDSAIQEAIFANSASFIWMRPSLLVSGATASLAIQGSEAKRP